MIFMIISIILTVSATVTAFILATASDLDSFFKRRAFPIITEYGQVFDSKEDLEVNLEVLQQQLMEKKTSLNSTRDKIQVAENAIDTLSSNSTEIKKYYLHLKAEVLKSEMECTELEKQIRSYQKRQKDLKDEIMQNENEYRAMAKELKAQQEYKKAVEQPSKMSSISLPL